MTIVVLQCMLHARVHTEYILLQLRRRSTIKTTILISPHPAPRANTGGSTGRWEMGEGWENTCEGVAVPSTLGRVTRTPSNRRGHLLFSRQKIPSLQVLAGSDDYHETDQSSDFLLALRSGASQRHTTPEKQWRRERKCKLQGPRREPRLWAEEDEMRSLQELTDCYSQPVYSR